EADDERVRSIRDQTCICSIVPEGPRRRVLSSLRRITHHNEGDDTLRVGAYGSRLYDRLEMRPGVKLRHSSPHVELMLSIAIVRLDLEADLHSCPIGKRAKQVTRREMVARPQVDVER